MYIHAGNNIAITAEDVVGIFDMDNTTVSRQGRKFLPRAQEAGRIVNATDDLPRSYIVTSGKHRDKVYISSYSTQMLSKRRQLPI